MEIISKDLTKNYIILFRG